MRRLLGPILAALALLAPAAAFAHPHIVVQQVVRMIAKDGKYTPVEIEYYKHGGILQYVLRQLLK